MECVMEKPLEKRVADTRQEPGTFQALLTELWQVAKTYVREAGLSNANLEYHAGAIVMTNAPFGGQACLCAIENNNVVPYF